MQPACTSAPASQSAVILSHASVPSQRSSVATLALLAATIC